MGYRTVLYDTSRSVLNLLPIIFLSPFLFFFEKTMVVEDIVSFFYLTI